MRRIALVVALALVLAFSAVSYAGPGAIKIMVNNQEVYPDVPPQVIDGRTMVPVRFVAEALGCTVKWDDITNTVSISKDKQASPNINYPLVIGPSRFTDVINESLSLIREKDSGTYYWLIANIEKIVYEEKPLNDRYGARINAASRTCYISKNDFDDVVKGGPDRENALIYLGVISHESAHTYLGATNLDKLLSYDEEEEFCNLIAYNTLLRVETDTSSIPLRLFKERSERR